MRIARGSTFEVTFGLPHEYDISDAKAVEITFTQFDKIIFTKTLKDVEIEEDGRHINLALSQEDTLKFVGNGSAKMQMRILTADDEAIVQHPITEIYVIDILKDGVIGDGSDIPSDPES